MMTSIPGTESNYIKIALLVLRISQKAVRVKFDFELHPECLQKTLNQNKLKLQDLLQKKKIHKDQWVLLFPPKEKGEASSTTFDITLMMCLIRNLAGIMIDNKLPPSSQTGSGDDLTRINVYRNKIAHVGNAQINDTDFSNYWDDISQAIIRLGGEELREECVQLKDKKFNIDEIEESVRHINMELAAVKNILQEVKDKMKYIEEEQNDPIPRNIREQITTQIDEWKNKDTKFFVITKRSEHALQRLEVSSCVVLTGGPGVGKTFIARHLALTFERKGYRLIPVLEPRDIRQFYEKGKKSIFIVDDMCGSYTANQHLVDNWQQLSPVIKTMLSDECCKIIVSCRRQIYLDERFKLLSPFQDCECNLMTKRLRTKEIKQMIARYNISAKVLSTESCKFECFPLLCSLYHENERVDTMEFFKNPFEIYRTELNNLDKSGFDGKCTLCGLALCVLFNNKIDEKWFQSKVNHDEENMLEDAYRVCGLNRGTSNVLIGEAFRTLEGTYICKQNGIYTTVHDRLFDFLVYHFGTKMLQCLIEHGNSNLIRERFRWRDPTETIDEFYACELGHDAIVRLLLDNGADLNIQRRPDVRNSKSGSNSLHIACLSGHTAVVTLLLVSKNVKININARDSNGYTPLIIACCGNFIEITSLLINAKADVDIQTSNGATALCFAVGNNNIETTELLLTNNASWQIGFQNRQQLIDATQHPGITLESVKEEIRNFVVKNASQQLTDYVNEQSEDYVFNAMAGSSPLHIASFMGHTQLVSCLLNFGAYVDFTKEDGTTPLFYACELGHDAIVRVLLDNGADSNIRRRPDVKDSKGGSNSLHIACVSGHTGVVNLLLTSKNVEININARNSNGYTPLINACYGNFTEITSILINAKADVNMQTSNGATALCLAVGYNNIDTTELLLTSNASWQIGFQNRQQLIDATQHPDVTLEGEKEEIRNFVLKNASQTVTDYVKKQSEDYIFDAMAGSLPLHIASFMGHTRIVSCLLNFGAFVDFTKEDGTTPLFYACELGHDDIVGLLLDKGADVTIRRQDGKSSLNIAECHGHQSIIAMLMERGTD